MRSLLVAVGRSGIKADVRHLAQLGLGLKF